MTRGRTLLMVAARAPVPGEVKTRLAATIGMDAAARLYRAFLRDLADRLDAGAGAHDLAWTHAPPDRDFRSDLEAITGRPVPAGTQFVPQDGPDWGVRQANLLRWGHEHGYWRTVLMASDSPQLPLDQVNHAFRLLERCDVVLGRVRDGGYYLVGMRGFHDVLSAVPMSTSSAADELVRQARTRGLTVGEIAPSYDIDIEDDLAWLRDDLARDPALCPATRRALAVLGLERS